MTWLPKPGVLNTLFRRRSGLKGISCSRVRWAACFSRWLQSLSLPMLVPLCCRVTRTVAAAYLVSSVITEVVPYLGATKMRFTVVEVPFSLAGKRWFDTGSVSVEFCGGLIPDVARSSCVSLCSFSTIVLLVLTLVYKILPLLLSVVWRRYARIIPVLYFLQNTIYNNLLFQRLIPLMGFWGFPSNIWFSLL